MTRLSPEKIYLGRLNALQVERNALLHIVNLGNLLLINQKIPLPFVNKIRDQGFCILRDVEAGIIQSIQPNETFRLIFTTINDEIGVKQAIE